MENGEEELSRDTCSDLPSSEPTEKRFRRTSDSVTHTTVPPALTADSPEDPWCDPNNPKIITFQDVSGAAYKIRGGIERTSCKKSARLSAMFDMEIFLKNESRLVTGSFKERGARNTLLRLTEAQKNAGVIAASAGNHALALCYHGQQLGIPVTVIMPTIAPLMKISQCRYYNATVLIEGRNIYEAREKALVIAKNQSLIYINGYDHPHIVAGQGTVALEIVEDVANLDAVLIPIGGAGLIAGMALVIKYLHPDVKIIGIEPKEVPSFTKALEAGKPVYAKPGSTIADGLAVPMVGYNSFATCKDLVDKVVQVSESSIALAILRLIEIEKCIVEGAGCIALAAIIEGLLPELKGKRVAMPLCGGNIDTTVLGRVLERGLAVDGRLVRFLVTVSDRPGGIADLTGLLAECGASIKDIFHERAWLRTDIFSVRVRVTIEAHDREHAQKIEKMLREHYVEVVSDMVF